MYIYQSMPDGIPHGPNGENLAEKMRVIEVDGQPADVVAILYNVDEAPPPVGSERTKIGRLVDTAPSSEDLGEQEYWADLPSGCCGGRRLKQTLAEDLAVCQPQCMVEVPSNSYLRKSRYRVYRAKCSYSSSVTLCKLATYSHLSYSVATRVVCKRLTLLIT